jgi:hypothetical protein
MPQSENTMPFTEKEAALLKSFEDAVTGAWTRARKYIERAVEDGVDPCREAPVGRMKAIAELANDVEILQAFVDGFVQQNNELRAAMGEVKNG